MTIRRRLVGLFLGLAVCGVALPVWAQTPTYIQSIASGREGDNPATSFQVTLRNPTQAGVALVVATEHDLTIVPTVTVTDNSGSTYTQNGGGSACTSACAAAVTSNGQGDWLFYATNVAAGTQTITITFNGASTSAPSVGTVVVAEFYNVATASPFRAFGTYNTAASTTPSIAIGATAGDLVFMWGSDTSTLRVNYSAAMTAGAGMTLLRSDRQAGTFAEYGTAVTTTAAFTHPGTDTWNAIAVALKPASAGGPAAAGIRVVKSEFHQYDATATVRDIPCTGNLQIVNWTSPDTTISITDSNSNTWTSAGSATAANGLINQLLYAPAATCTPTQTLTVHYNSVSAGLNGMSFYDVTGAATSPFDNATTSNGNLATAGNVVSGSITPTTTNGLVINGLAVFWHSLTSCTASTGTCIMTSVTNPLNNNDPADGCTNIPGTAASTMWEDDGHAHVYNATTGAITFTYPNTSSATCTTNKGVGNWASVSAAFKTAAVGTCPKTFQLLGVGC